MAQVRKGDAALYSDAKAQFAGKEKILDDAVMDYLLARIIAYRGSVAINFKLVPVLVARYGLLHALGKDHHPRNPMLLQETFDEMASIVSRARMYDTIIIPIAYNGIQDDGNLRRTGHYSVLIGQPQTHGPRKWFHIDSLAAETAPPGEQRKGATQQEYVKTLIEKLALPSESFTQVFVPQQKDNECGIFVIAYVYATTFVLEIETLNDTFKRMTRDVVFKIFRDLVLGIVARPEGIEFGTFRVFMEVMSTRPHAMYTLEKLAHDTPTNLAHFLATHYFRTLPT